MKAAYTCDGISTRQHNEPGGYQDVWHYHVHVTPRYMDDGFYSSRREFMPAPERAKHAARLRRALTSLTENDAPTLTGRVFSGQGNFSYWIDQLQAHYDRKTRMHLFPGTLNLQLPAAYDLPADRIIRLEKEEYGGSVSVDLLPCRVFGHGAFILRTDANASGRGPYPTSVIESATDIRLRDMFRLKDGDVVGVEVEAEIGAR
jgi:CTP-dependent riboflavin kinase